MTTGFGTAEELGRAIRRARQARAMRLEDLAAAAGVGIRFVSELERGKETARLAETLRVTQALGLSLWLDDPHG